MRSLQRRVVLVVAVLLLAVGCGNFGKDNDEDESSDRWDTMKWDEGTWGQVDTSAFGPRVGGPR